MTREEQITHMKKLVLKLNQYRDEYYNQNAPSIPDSTYDRLFDELEVLEKRTGIILSGSPTQTVGYHPVSELPKVKHPIPLLSLDKTKLTRDILDFVQKGKGLTNLTLKMDGLTVKLVYDGGIVPIRRCRSTLGYRKGCLQQDCDQWYLVYRNRSCIDCISFIALCGI